MPRMQQPTCTNIRIRSTADAHKIFYAIQKGTLRMVTRRLDSDERLALSSGCVYAWEERGPHTEITGLGIERFTEGRRWSPSRVRDEFLFYYEKYSPPESNGPEKQQAPRDWDPLVKQTYSVWVETDKGRRKWHLTAYFTQLTVDNLKTIDDVLGVGDLVVPEGMFKSTRVNKSRGKTDESARNNSDSTSRESVSSSSRTYAPFPAPYPPSASAQNTSLQSVSMYEPYPTSFPRSPEQPYATTPLSRHVPLPTRTPYQNGNRVIPPPDYADTRFSPSPRLPSGLTTPGPSYGVPSHFLPSLSYSPAPSDHNGSAVYSPQQVSPSQPQSHQQSWYPYQPADGYLPQPQLHAPSPMRPPDSPSVYSLQQQQHQFSLIEGPSNFPTSDSPSLMSPQPAAAKMVEADTATSYSPVASAYVPRSVTEITPASYAATPPFSSGPSDVDRVPSPAGSSASSAHSGEIGRQRDLAPLHSLKRHHPYKRRPEDDKTLRLLDPRPVPSAP